MTVGAFIILASALVTLYNWIQGFVVGESVSARSVFRADVFLLLHAVFRGTFRLAAKKIAGAAKCFLRPVNLINLHKIVLASAGHHQTPPVRCHTANVCMRYV
ncbi:MAG: hypothetical protein HZA69_08030 [Gammaproteobacteria bacterium]|nr:hypothetical protein [Gammaproteobacteria bacterium]